MRLIPRDLRTNPASTAVWLASKRRNKLRSGGDTISIVTQGIGAGMTAGAYDLTQESATAQGINIVANCTITALGDTTINSITTAGTNYIVGEIVTLSDPSAGPAFTTNPTIRIDGVR